MVSVIVVAYKDHGLLLKCIDSVFRQKKVDFELLVVFNVSPPESVEKIKKEFPKIIPVANAQNLMFCRACNDGISGSKGEFILCLNDDVVLEEDYLEKTLSVFAFDERIGSVTGKIMRPDKATIDSTGLFLGYSRRPIERGYGERDNGQFDGKGYVFGVSGCAGLYRRKMLEDVRDRYGYFDERFGMFYEDLDLAWRAQRKSWHAYYNPRAVCFHSRGASARTEFPALQPLRKYGFACISAELQQRLIRNRHLTMRKNDSLLQAAVNLPFILVYELKLYLYLLLKACRLSPTRSGIPREEKS